MTSVFGSNPWVKITNTSINKTLVQKSVIFEIKPETLPTKKQKYYIILITIVSGVLTTLLGVFCYFLLGIQTNIPFIFWGYTVAVLVNLGLFLLHKNLDISYITTAFLVFLGSFLVAMNSGGISSPMIYILPSIIIAGYIMRRKYGRYTAIFISLAVLAIYLLEFVDGAISNHVPLESQAEFSLLSIIMCIVMLGGILGDFMAKNSYYVYKAKKYIEIQNQEKEILLKEIHHRVKNNLQIVMSLLKLQGYLIKDEKTLQIFDETRGRIYSMALTHEMLYKGDDLANIGYDKYVERLILNLVDSLSLEKEKVFTDIHIPEVKINLDTAIPLGLVINEVITNALKYGANSEGQTHIFIKLSVIGKEDFILEISDTGKGINEEITHENSDSLGLQLIQTLAEQLDGEITRKSEEGTKYTLIFKAQ